MRYIPILLLVVQIACTPDAPHHPIVGSYTVAQKRMKAGIQKSMF